MHGGVINQKEWDEREADVLKMSAFSIPTPPPCFVSLNFQSVLELTRESACLGALGGFIP
ncbi:hypothetical protein KS4_36990 [Poriferisphaera corsica]|uniref:Uncharacterized protein n=1 Tax=Poriferisphaera corsica TaxID=2528020 RepID=A0A517YZE5_9BACT|nr:hypothetical protein KS4_36990 [Poriferisphaera corsica]